MQEQGQDPAGLRVPPFPFSGRVLGDQIIGAPLGGGEVVAAGQDPPPDGGGEPAEPGRVEDVHRALGCAGLVDGFGQVQPGRGRDQGAGGVQAVAGERHGLADPGSGDAQGGVFAGGPDLLAPPSPAQAGDLDAELTRVQPPPLPGSEAVQGRAEHVSLQLQRRRGGVLGDIQPGRDPAGALVQVGPSPDQRLDAVRAGHMRQPPPARARVQEQQARQQHEPRGSVPAQPADQERASEQGGGDPGGLPRIPVQHPRGLKQLSPGRLDSSPRRLTTEAAALGVWQ